MNLLIFVYKYLSLHLILLYKFANTIIDMKLPVCKPIDALLSGGIESGTITNFYGPPASGKTNIAFCAVVSCIISGKKVVYVDTEGGFSIERLEQIYGSKEFSDFIFLFEPKTWEEQMQTIEKIQEICNNEDIGLVVVDSITALWRLTITNENAVEINKEIATHLSFLSKLARERKIPILITNQVYSDIETGKIEMSNKNIVKWWSKNLVELSLTGETGCRLARIERARSLPENKEIKFRIVENGLETIENYMPAAQISEPQEEEMI